MHASNLKLENVMTLFIQFAGMKKSYHRFHEILFIDNQIKHATAAQATANAQLTGPNQKPDEFKLILLSGINNEGKNVLFGFGLIKTLDYKNLKWILKQFVEFSKHPVHGKIYPATVIS